MNCGSQKSCAALMLQKTPVSPSKQIIMAPTQNSQHLPDNAIMEILIRLSVKDLSRFKCVCTNWLSLISSPLFISLHLNRSVSDPSSHYILVSHFQSHKPISPDPFRSIIYCLCPEAKFAGSVNGLVCIVGHITDGEMVRPDDIWIWNPSSRHSKKLPLGKHTSSPTKHTSSRRNMITFAFGWDSIANDYKVVKIVSKLKATLAEVWTSNSDSWREIKVDRNFYHPHCMASVTICDAVVEGFAYWIVMDDLKNLLVASFDMRSEVLQLISMPKLSIPHERLVQSIWDKDMDFFGTNWKGNFGLAECYLERYPAQMYHLWTLDGGVGKELWSKKFSFRIDGRFVYCMNSINGKFVLKSLGVGVILYDVETQETMTIGEPRFEFCVGEVYDYVESLVSIKGFNPLGEDMIRMINVVWPLNQATVGFCYKTICS